MPHCNTHLYFENVSWRGHVSISKNQFVSTAQHGMAWYRNRMPQCSLSISGNCFVRLNNAGGSFTFTLVYRPHQLDFSFQRLWLIENIPRFYEKTSSREDDRYVLMHMNEKQTKQQKHTDKQTKFSWRPREHHVNWLIEMSYKNKCICKVSGA